MGLSISWIAVSGKAKADILQCLSLVDTTDSDEANESPVSGAQLPGGWYVLFLNQFDHPFARAPLVQRLSAGCKVVVCQVEEHVMTSVATLYENSINTWRVTHESESGMYHLEKEGVPPPSLDEIYAALKVSQDADGGFDADVDHIFDVPVGLAAALCGYRHDEVALASGEEPKFTELVATST